MPIPDASTVASDWQSGAQAKSSKLVRRYLAATNIAENATAADAVQRWKTNVSSDFATKKRSSKLLKVGTAGMKAAMQAKGAANYSTGISASKDKYQQGIAVVLSDLATLQTGAPKRGSTVDENLQRVAWYAKGLHDAAAKRYQ